MQTIKLEELPRADDKTMAARRTLAKCLRDVHLASEDENLPHSGYLGLLQKMVGN